MRDSEPAAKAMGVPTAHYKVGGYALAGSLAAVGGSLSVLVQPYPYVDPRTYAIALSIALVTGLVVGGSTSVVGAVLAALFLDRAPGFVTDVAHLDGAATNVFYGGLLILLMFVMPGGIVGLAAALRKKTTRRRRVADKADPAVRDFRHDHQAEVLIVPMCTPVHDPERIP